MARLDPALHSEDSRELLPSETLIRRHNPPVTVDSGLTSHTPIYCPPLWSAEFRAAAASSMTPIFLEK